MNEDFASETSLAAQLFGEDQGRYLVAVRSDYEGLIELTKAEGIPVRWVGYTGAAHEDQLEIGDFGEHGKIPLADLRAAHESFFSRLMGADAALA